MTYNVFGGMLSLTQSISPWIIRSVNNFTWRMTGRLLQLIYLLRLLIQIPNTCCLVTDDAFVNMGFSDKDQILTKKWYIFKGAKNLLRNFWIKFGDCRDWTNFWKSCKKLARQSSSSRFKTVWMDDNNDALMFFYSVIFIHKLDITNKEEANFCKFSQLQHYQLLSKSVNNWPSNH